jgi:hypothetical protein
MEDIYFSGRAHRICAFVSFDVYIIRAAILVFVGTSTYLSPDFVKSKTTGKLVATSKVTLNSIGGN